jgi:hypothetical protein
LINSKSSVFCERHNSQHHFLAEQMTFDIYGLTADETTPWVNENKTTWPHIFSNALYLT